MDQLLVAAKSGDWKRLDMSKITSEAISSYHHKRGNLLHVAAWARKLKKVPKHLLSKEGLNCPDKRQDTIFHIAAQHNELSTIPKKFFTEEILEKKNEEGNTVFHYAAFAGCLDAIPDKFLSDRNLAIENSHKHGSLEYALAAWNPNKKDPQNESVKETIDLILSKHGKERLKYYIARYQDRINQYNELLKGVKVEAAKLHVEKMVKETTQKQALIIKEMIRRKLPKLTEQKPIEI